MDLSAERREILDRIVAAIDKYGAVGVRADELATALQISAGTLPKYLSTANRAGLITRYYRGPDMRARYTTTKPVAAERYMAPPDYVKTDNDCCSDPRDGLFGVREALDAVKKHLPLIQANYPYIPVLSEYNRCVKWYTTAIDETTGRPAWTKHTDWLATVDLWMARRRHYADMRTTQGGPTSRQEQGAVIC